jgi:hypothetical protein
MSRVKCVANGKVKRSLRRGFLALTAARGMGMNGRLSGNQCDEVVVLGWA